MGLKSTRRAQLGIRDEAERRRRRQDDAVNGTDCQWGLGPHNPRRRWLAGPDCSSSLSLVVVSAGAQQRRDGCKSWKACHWVTVEDARGVVRCVRPLMVERVDDGLKLQEGGSRI